MNKILGIFLIVIGLVGLIWGGFEYTSQKKVLDIGPLHATRTEHHTVPVPPVVGALLLAGGVVILAVRHGE